MLLKGFRFGKSFSPAKRCYDNDSTWFSPEEDLGEQCSFMTVLSGSDAHDCDQTSSNGLCTIIGKSPYILITGSVSANCQAVHATRSTFLCQLFSRYENVNSIIGLAVPLPYTIDTINDQRLWPPTQFCLILG